MQIDFLFFFSFGSISLPSFPLFSRDVPREGIIRLCIEKPAFIDDTTKLRIQTDSDEEIECAAQSPRASDPCDEKWEKRYLSLSKGVLAVYEVADNAGAQDMLGRIIGGRGKLIETHPITQLLSIRVSYSRNNQLEPTSPTASGSSLDSDARKGDSNEFTIRLSIPTTIVVDGEEREQYSTVTWRIRTNSVEEANQWIFAFMRAITVYVLPQYQTPPVTPSPVMEAPEDRQAFPSPKVSALPGEKPLSGLSFAKAPIESPSTLSDGSPKPAFLTPAGPLTAIKGAPSPVPSESSLASDLRSLNVQRKPMPVSCSMGSIGFLSQVPGPKASGPMFEKLGQLPTTTSAAPEGGLSFAKQGIGAEAPLFKKEPTASFLASSLRPQRLQTPITEIKEEEEESDSTPKLYVPPSLREPRQEAVIASVASASILSTVATVTNETATITTETTIATTTTTTAETVAPGAGLYVPPAKAVGAYTFGGTPRPKPPVIFGDHAPSATAGPPSMCRPASVWHGASSPSGGIWLAQGVRGTMEDAFIMEGDVVEYIKRLELTEDMSSIMSNPKIDYEKAKTVKKTEFYAIFDGHSGKFAAEYAAVALPMNLVNHKLFNSDRPEDLSKALTDAFHTTDWDFLRSVHAARADGIRHKKWTSGTTALALIIRDSTMVVASIGDCRAIMSIPEQPPGSDAKKIPENVIRPCNCEFRPVVLSVDHTPLSEQERIGDAGGWVTTEHETQIPRLGFFDNRHLLVQTRIQQKSTGTRRKIVSRLNGDLGVSRAFGDADFKGELMKSYPWCWPKNTAPREFTADLVLATPDITYVTMDSQDHSLSEHSEAEKRDNVPFHTRYVSFNREGYRNCKCRPFIIMACDGLWDVLSDSEVTTMAGAQLAAQRYKQERASDTEVVEAGPIAAARSLANVAIQLGTCDNVTTLVIPL